MSQKSSNFIQKAQQIISMKPTFKISSPFLTRPPVVTTENLPDGMRGLVGQAMRLQD